MDVKKVKKVQFLDRVWYEQLRKIGSLESGNFAEKKQDLVLDHVNHQVHLTHGHKSDIKVKEGVRKRVKSKLRSLRRFEQNILKHEKNSLIRSTYLNQVTAGISFAQISKIKLNTTISNTEKNNKIHQAISKIYKLPSIEENTMFINELIFFLKYFKEKGLIGKEFDVILSHDFYKISVQSLEIDTKYLVESCISFDKNISSVSEKKYNAREVKEVFKKVVMNMGIAKYSRIKIRDRHLFSVHPGSRSVSIPKNIQIDSKRLSQIISHEIIVHLYRTILGRINTTSQGKKLKLLQMGTPAYLATEEGLASYFEQNVLYDSSKYDIMNLFNFYLRTITVHLALNFEPYEVYEKLDLLCRAQASIQDRDQFYASDARDLLMVRAYRGFVSPQKGCVNAKIGQYLSGNRMIWNFVENGGNINNLFAGKVSLNDLEELKNLGFIVPDELFGSKEFPRKKLLAIINSSM